MLNAGFQYLEQRDANDTITKDGVVGKNSPFATSDNSGIYDIIAEDLRWLKENVDDVKDTSDLEAIKQSVTDMYNEMKNDSSFGEAAAKAQAEEAKKQAQAALESATNAKTYRDDVVTKSTEANDTLAEIKEYIDKAEKLVDSNKALEQSFSDYATMASNKAKAASDSATNAAASESAAKTSETNVKTSETNAKTSETNAAKSESDAKAHMNATATSASNAKASESAAKKSETNSKTSETNAKASESAAKTSETNASNSADLAKKWAESSESPDTMNDEDSTTGKTQSSKSWALYARDRAISAYSSESNAKASETASKTSETNAKTSETNAAKSESNAKASEIASKTSETNAAASASSAKTSEDNASTSKSNAKNSETNAKSYMATAKEYMQKAQEALAAAQAIQSVVDTAKANAEKCLADVEAVKESLAKMITYQGSVDNYSDLPTSPQVGYSYNIKNADKEHGVNAGDNVVWNGTDWDNFGGAIDMSLFAELGKDARFNTVTATLNGNAATASKLATPRTLSLTGKAAGSTTFDGSANASINVTSVNADTATKATQDGAGNVITNTYLKKAGDTATGDLTAPNFVGHLKGNADTATHANDIADATMNMTVSTKENAQTTAAAGVIDQLESLTGSTDLKSMSKLRSFVGSVFGPDWYNVISIRHRNGAGDGQNYGLLMYSRFENTDSIKYKKQGFNGWTEERTLLDSSNYNSYAPTKTGSGASGTWGINITGNAATATTADNAKKLGGYALNTESTGGHFGTIPKVGTDGVMEVGKYIDWHSQNGGSADYTSRWEAQNNGTVTVGTINGTLNGNAATATKALNVPTSDVGGNIWIA